MAEKTLRQMLEDDHEYAVEFAMAHDESVMELCNRLQKRTATLKWLLKRYVRKTRIAAPQHRGDIR